MNENRSVVLRLGIIAFLLLGVVYYYVIYPKSEMKTSTIHSIEQLKRETAELESRVSVLGVADIAQDDFELRKKLPAERDLDTLLHRVHEVESMSDAQIVSIRFNHYDEEVAQAKKLLPTEEEDKKNDENVDEQDGEKPVTPIEIELLPEQLKFISLELEVRVLDEEHLLTFLKEIESIERVVRIDEVEFNQLGEVELTKKDPDERVLVTVQLTTFYSEEVEG